MLLLLARAVPITFPTIGVTYARCGLTLCLEYSSIILDSDTETISVAVVVVVTRAAPHSRQTEQRTLRKSHRYHAAPLAAAHALLFRGQHISQITRLHIVPVPIIMAAIAQR